MNVRLIPRPLLGSDRSTVLGSYFFGGAGAGGGGLVPAGIGMFMLVVGIAPSFKIVVGLLGIDLLRPECGLYESSGICFC